MKIFKKRSLRTDDGKRTRAAELTLRESIYPLVLVTILFFLWVRWSVSVFYTPNHQHYFVENERKQISETTPIHTTQCLKLMIKNLGLLLRPPRHPKQTLPRLPLHLPRPLLRPPSRLLRRLPPRLPRPRKLPPPPLRLQTRLHLGPLPLRPRRPHRLALPRKRQFRRLLRRHLHHRQWVGGSRNSGESVYYCLRTAAVCGVADQFESGV